MKQQQAGRLWGLDLLKFLCAIVILNWHIYPTDGMRFLFTGKIVDTFLICSGYVWCLSLDRKHSNFKTYYTKNMWRHLVQIFLPYTILFFIEVFYHSFWITWTSDAWLWLDPYPQGDSHGYFRVREMFALFWQGGLGPGGYYIGFLLQLVVIFGVVYWLGKRFPKGFLAISIALFLIGSFYRFPIWQAYEWLLQNVIHIRPLAQDQIVMVMLGSSLYYNRDWLPRWGWAPLLLLSVMSSWLGFASTDVLQAWCALWCALELSRLKLPTPATTLIGHLGRASYFIYLMQKAYCASAISRWLALKWELYNEWNILFCLLLGILFYGLYTLLAKLFWQVANTKKHVTPV